MRGFDRDVRASGDLQPSPLRELIHKRFGLSFPAPLLGASLALNLLVFASEIGGA
jgi:hypothetical protein